MWYADRNAVPLNAGAISPPLPHRKVDPKYIPAAADERVEGQVRLSCVIQKNGRVDLVELVKGLDDRLDQSAIDALAKWVTDGAAWPEPSVANRVAQAAGFLPCLE